LCQMILDLVLIGVVVRLVAFAIKIGRKRHVVATQEVTR
jgi:hypothetical protein